MKKVLAVLCCWITSQTLLLAQQPMKGMVKDIANDEPVINVNIKNVNSGIVTKANADGSFTMPIKKNDLVEITHISYETIRIRIKNDNSNMFYSLVLRPKTNKLMEIFVREKNKTFKADSVRNYETYKQILEKPGVDEMSASTAPMAMMSNKFREEQAFKQNYKKWEKEKYVDYMFNAKQLAKWTGLQADSLTQFINIYRPSYEFLRSNSDYNYLLYIKNSLREYCKECVFNRK